MTSENIGMTMPVAPYYGGNNGGGGFGFDGFGGGWGLLILLAVLGWGNGGFGFGGGMGGGMFPWMMAGQMNGNNDVQRGFDQAAVIGGINGVQTAINGLQPQLCNGFAGVTAAVNNGFAQAEIANNARQMADMQQMFGVQSALQNCCCENRASVADLKYTVATEACADRAAVNDALNSTLNAMNAGIQSLKDQMCQDKIDAKNERIAELQQQLYMRDLAASQTAQTATIQAGQRALANEVEQYVAPNPRPAYIVQNPNCCPNNYGCGYQYA